MAHTLRRSTRSRRSRPAVLPRSPISLFADQRAGARQISMRCSRATIASRTARPRTALAARIDAAAHQRYATVSRLYWHTDLASARTAAREHGGRFCICACSAGSTRICRARTAGCSAPRCTRTRTSAGSCASSFVLYWSSERPVPRVTIDYGDGRKLERTTTGNSAHYVLDDDGNVLDVLPGLYAPAAFRRELEGSLALAARVRGTSDEERATAGSSTTTSNASIAAQRTTGSGSPPRRGSVATWQLTTAPRVRGRPRRCPAPHVLEGGDRVKDLRQFARDLAPEAVAGRSSRDVVRGGSGALRHRRSAGRCAVTRAGRREPRADRSPAQSRCRASCARPTNNCDAMIARLEQTLVADSALNQLRLRPQIGREIVRQRGRDRLRDAECLDLRRGVSHAEAGRLARPLAAQRVHRRYRATVS